MPSTKLSTASFLAWLASAGLAYAYYPLPTLPTIPAYTTNVVVSFSASTNSSDNATAINNAITAVSAHGGGTVEIPGPGTYLSGPITMKSKVNLQIDAGATLQMLPYVSWPGTTSFILGASLADVEISGSGTIDGQGAAWWAAFNSGGISRPNFIEFSKTQRILIQNVKLQNPPTFHLMLKGNNGNITIQGINIETDPSSPNTDGMDLGSTNILVQNSHISDGDDNIEIGGSSGKVAYLTVTNCIFGHGHGVSAGSLVQAGVSNVLVINCTFTNTDYGIRMKSDNDRGGVVQNLSYLNISMTNILYTPILIYSYYSTHGSPSNDGITPAVAEATAVAGVSSTTPIWRGIVISNFTARAAEPGMIWARTELPASDIVLNKLNITSTDSAAGNSAFSLYNVRGVQVVDSQMHVAGSKSFALFNAEVTFTNSATGASAITLDGAAVTNLMAFYNQPASLSDSTAFDATPIALGASTLSDGTSLSLAGTTPVNFTLGSNAAQVAVSGNLALDSTLNVIAGGGFGAGNYTLFTYTGSFSGSPVLGTLPGGFNYSLTNGAGKVNLVVAAPCVSPTATVSGGGTICGGDSVNIQAALSGTQPWTVTWSDGFVQSGVAASPAIRSVSPSATTAYTVTDLSDANGCAAGTLSGSAAVTVNAHPTAAVSGGGAVCGGSSVNIQAALTGTQPWTVTWSDGVVQGGVTASPAIRSVSPGMTTNYTVTALSDAHGCLAGTLSGSALVTVCALGPFRITSAQLQAPGNFVLTWDSVSSHVYQVQSIDSLAAGTWKTNATIVSTGSSTSWTNTGVSGVTERCYRVVNTP